MSRLNVIAINHVCLVVRDKEITKAFYTGILGFQPHPRVKSWLVMSDLSTLHLVARPDVNAGPVSPNPGLQHFPLQIADLRDILVLLLAAGRSPFQMNRGIIEHTVKEPDDPLSFGTQTLFVRDPDGNLIEFVELGRGLFSARTSEVIDKTKSRSAP
jgi:catechol 2,3-dioxygenase-like lactoylglutathione lyase family enzyme